jgi:hypothetical protein
MVTLVVGLVVAAVTSFDVSHPLPNCCNVYIRQWQGISMTRKSGIAGVTACCTASHTQVILVTLEGAWKLAGFTYAIATDYASGG